MASGRLLKVVAPSNQFECAVKHLSATILGADGALDSFLADFNRRTLASWAVVAFLGFGDCMVLSFWIRFRHPSRSYNLGLYRASAEGEGVTNSLAICPKVLSMKSHQAKIYLDLPLFRGWRMGSAIVSELVHRARWACRMTTMGLEGMMEVAPKRYIKFEDGGCKGRDTSCQGACCLMGEFQTFPVVGSRQPARFQERYDVER